MPDTTSQVLESSEAAATTAAAAHLRPRMRAYVVGIPLLIGVCFLSVYADMVSQVVQFGVLQFAPPAIFGLFLVALVNRVLKKVAPAGFLSAADLLVIYAMSVVGVLVSTRGVIEKLVPSLAYLPYFATRENKLNENITQHLPNWLVPFTPSSQPGNASPAINDYWNGGTHGIPWAFWLPPLIAWLALWSCVLLVFLCLATLLRRQWMDNEQLRFPLTALPLAIIKDEAEGGDFFTNRLMWSGALFAALVFAINGWAANNSDVPQVMTHFDLGPYFSDKPWNKMDGIPLYMSLAGIGFAYFLPLDLLFSMWFFYFATRFQDIAYAQFGGVPTGNGTHNARIHTGYQVAGAYIVLVGAQVKIGWPYFKEVIKSALGREAKYDDSEEMMSYRSASIGLVLGFLGIVVWLSIAGMSPWLAALQMGLFLFFIAIVMTRAVSEAGLLMTETSFLPAHVIGLLFPLQGLGATNLTMMGLTNAVFIRDQRGGLLSTFFDTQRLARDLKVPYRSLIAPLVSAFFIAFCVATWFFLHLNYKSGGTSLYHYSEQQNPNSMYVWSAARLHGGNDVSTFMSWGNFLGGAAFTVLLIWARAQFSWFPLHPLGFALAPTWAMNVFWFPFFLAWVIKSCIMRFGGIDTWKKVSPFMLGLIVGEFGMAIFWSLMNMSRGWSAPQFPWP